MSESQPYGFIPWEGYETTPEMMVGETVFDAEGKSVGWIVGPDFRSECHDKNGFDPSLGFECTTCGATVDSYMVTPLDMSRQVQFHYCPFCGAKVIE